MPDLDGPTNLEWLTSLDAQLAGLNLAHICPLADHDVALDVDVAQVVVIVVRAGDHTGTATQNLVGIDRDALDTDCAQASRFRAKQLDDLGITRRAKSRRAQHAAKLGLLKLVVTTQ